MQEEDYEMPIVAILQGTIMATAKESIILVVIEC